MVIFEFKIDENSLADDLKANPISANPAALQETYFEMPIRLSVNDVELFEFPGSHNPWLRLPLLDVATVGIEKVKRLKSEKNSTYYLPGGWELRFRKNDAFVTILSTINMKTVETSYDDIMESFLAFNVKVKSFLLESVPMLVDHPYWGEFLKKSR